MEIRDFTTEEIEKELKRRLEIVKMVRPVLLENPDLTELIIRCEEYINLTEINDTERFDYESIIQEETISALYGAAGWEYINYCENPNREINYYEEY